MNRADKSLIVATVITLTCVVSGSILTFLNKDVIGISLIIGSLGTVLAGFFSGAVLRKKEREDKRKQDTNI
jgi:5-bromo-4-chloroindolyl phosphate hydrolysis protein